MVKTQRKPLGESLVEKGLITREKLIEAQRVLKKEGEESLGQILVRMGFVTEKALVDLFEEGWGIPYVDLSVYSLDPRVIDLVPESLARRWHLIPIFQVGDTLMVAMVDPLNVLALDEIRLKSGCEVEPAVSTPTAIEGALNQYYGVTETMTQAIEEIKIEKPEVEERMEIEKLRDIAEEPPIIRLVNLVIAQAIRDRASDIHIEPDEKVLRTRFRIDGVLHEASTTPKHLQSAIISRIKIMSKLDIAERRRPQDGHFRLRMENKEIDFRVSIFPTVFGENVSIRLLDRSSILFGLDQLGFLPQVLKTFRQVIKNPHGIILVTGPTGCGKTTTLYAALKEISSMEKNIITIEDPVEYELGLIRQSQINPKAGLTFATGLRSILRQDPDVIMVGEIRDGETADIAVNAALTGHLVFSTLHTNDAAGAITRLIDMGEEPFLVASSIIVVLAQRLVRIICPKCKESYLPDEEILKRLGFSQKELYRGRGCRYCAGTGYLGRTALFELMVIDEHLRELIQTKQPSGIIKKAAREAGMMTLQEDGLQKVMQGITTIEEVMRAAKIT